MASAVEISKEIEAIRKEAESLKEHIKNNLDKLHDTTCKCTNNIIWLQHNNVIS